jgi:hypothetical protein
MCSCRICILIYTLDVSNFNCGKEYILIIHDENEIMFCFVKFYCRSWIAMIECWEKYSGRGWIAMIALSDETSSAMIFYRSPELGVWGLPKNVAFLKDEHMAVWGLNPTANLSKTQNATFWVRVGEKGPYLGRGEVVLQEASSSILQIVQTRHFEKTLKGGGGPTKKDLLEKGEETEKTRDRARRITAESVGDLARGAGLATGGSPGGVTTVVRNAERVRRGESLMESTHRHDRVMVEFEREARGVKRSREVAEKGGKDKKFYEEVAVCIA